MALENIANSSAVITPTNGTGAITIQSAPSIKSIAGSGVHRGTVNLFINGATQGTCVQAAPNFAATISGSASKVKADGLAVLRKGDTGSASIPGTAPGPVACTINLDYEVSVPGQIKVSAE